MENIQQYKYEKQSDLCLKFKDVKKLLEIKYNVPLDFTIEYDILMVGGINKDIKAISADLIKDVVNYAKENLDEDYELFPLEPLYISDNPNNIYSPDSRIHYNFRRLLKDNEPE